MREHDVYLAGNDSGARHYEQHDTNHQTTAAVWLTIWWGYSVCGE